MLGLNSVLLELFLDGPVEQSTGCQSAPSRGVQNGLAHLTRNLGLFATLFGGKQMRSYLESARCLGKATECL